tara:strand:+ start:149 stop:352 length:204 start_codon:yes stop_codon:yes gene_type:complete
MLVILLRKAVILFVNQLHGLLAIKVAKELGTNSEQSFIHMLYPGTQPVGFDVHGCELVLWSIVVVGC